MYVEFQGKNIAPRPGSQNGASVFEFDNGHKAVANSSGSCSCSIICEVNGYQVIVNVIFGGFPSSST